MSPISMDGIGVSAWYCRGMNRSVCLLCVRSSPMMRNW